MNLAQHIRVELKKSEEYINNNWRWAESCLNYGNMKAYYYHRELVSHFSGRRRFYLRELLRVQLKEFDRG